MAWQQYGLLYRLESPVHIGRRKIGNLMQARPYVPGKVLWAALTAGLTQGLGLGNDGRAYREIGDLARQFFRPGYLWPASADNPAAPQLMRPDENLEQALLGSYVSTALDYDQESALEGSLHEIEFIAPVLHDGRQVYLMGDIWVQDVLPEKLADWGKALQTVKLGAERAYGWGQARLADGYPRRRPAEQSQDPEHILVEKGPLLAHVLAEPLAVKFLRGALEPFGGWETLESGVLQMGGVQIAFAPPAMIKESDERPVFLIRPDGLWQVTGQV